MNKIIRCIATASALALSPVSAFAANECYIDFLYMGDDPDASIAACSTMLAQEQRADTQSKILLYRGQAYLKKKDLDHALADFESALRLDPNNALAFSERASFYRFERHDLARAIADLTSAIRLEPRNYAYLSARAALYAETGKLESATADFDAAIQAAPKNTTLLTERGNIWRRRGDYEKAVADFEATLQTNPTYGNALRARAAARAMLALGPTLASAGQPPQQLPETRFQRAAVSESGSYTVETWNLDGKLHHCAITAGFNEPVSALGRSAAGYALTLASGKWSFTPQTSYPVSVVADAAELKSTATAADAITVGIPLKPTAGFLSAWNSAFTLQVKAASTTITAESSGDSVLKVLDACWDQANKTANPFAPARTQAPKTDPFAPPTRR